MKIILPKQFDLNDPDDKEEFKLLCQAADYKKALDDILDILRSYDKYGIPENIKTPEELIYHLREKIWKDCELWRFSHD